jgi:hypothetical protein
MASALTEDTRDGKRRRRTRQRLLKLSIGLAILGLLVPATASATDTECNPNPFQSANECTKVVGTGLYVDSIGGQLFSNTYDFLRDVHIEIYGPGKHGPRFLHNCASFTLDPLGVSDVCLWVNPEPHVRVRAGDYCSQAWQWLHQQWIVVSTECVGVHE